MSAAPITEPIFISWRRAREYVLSRDLFICSYCLDDADQVDHIVPVTRMGPFLAPSNLTACCGPCNRSKGALTPQEWFARDWAGRTPPWFAEGLSS
jgi:5-methylcytosine-specific restriction endonuclease McrA